MVAKRLKQLKNSYPNSDQFEIFETNAEFENIKQRLMY